VFMPTVYCHTCSNSVHFAQDASCLRTVGHYASNFDIKFNVDKYK